jgi:hypothetical protein
MEKKEKNEKKVKKILSYAKRLLGIKYTGWNMDIKDKNFFYVEEIPSFESVQEKGITCTGFINILRQVYGSKIPESNSVRGGTVFWYKYFRKNHLLEKFDYTKDYPLGTLFLRKYRNIEDQGHVAIFFKKYRKDPTKLLYGKIIHAFADESTGGYVGITTLGYSHFYGPNGKEGYYEFAIAPQNWLQ